MIDCNSFPRLGGVHVQTWKHNFSHNCLIEKIVLSPWATGKRWTNSAGPDELSEDIPEWFWKEWDGQSRERVLTDKSGS